MTKSTVPRGSTQKEKCINCNRLFYPYLTSTGKLIKICQVCLPEEEKKR